MQEGDAELLTYLGRRPHTCRPCQSRFKRLRSACFCQPRYLSAYVDMETVIVNIKYYWLLLGRYCVQSTSCALVALSLACPGVMNWKNRTSKDEEADF